MPFLLFAGAGLAALLRYRTVRDWRWFAGIALAALAILLVSLPSSINLGVRHVLVLYPLLALASAYGLVRLSEHSARRLAVLTAGCAGVVLQAALLWTSVPNQITYYNVLAGADPGWVSGSSNFDWGQSGVALEQYFKDRPVSELYILLSGTLRPCRMKLPPLKSLPDHPVSGWIAISDSPYRANGGTISEDPCGVPDSPGPRRRAPDGWLDWLKAEQPGRHSWTHAAAVSRSRSDPGGRPVTIRQGRLRQCVIARWLPLTPASGDERARRHLRARTRLERSTPRRARGAADPFHANARARGVQCV